jgi:hypothetical protein
MSRSVTVYYEDAAGEHPVTVEVEDGDARGDARIWSDLDDLGVPESEQAGVKNWAIEKYWAAERAAYLLATPDAEDEHT